ncbi:hypothetical protein KGF54_001144 [Candida jiufengensis]|uniref:uncharacterized protein n=1 Tax=Candida jiufengensis TaxID=497108 RepID=UPI0022252AA7|nr:uncharacterized protein KGF54_001144 [Candida jiufengensis]KAI5955642.1 hypothetical protein KGF54_001144 [Candida jiufengensis]
MNTTEEYVCYHNYELLPPLVNLFNTKQEAKEYLNKFSTIKQVSETKDVLDFNCCSPKCGHTIRYQKKMVVELGKQTYKFQLDEEKFNALHVLKPRHEKLRAKFPLWRPPLEGEKLMKSSGSYNTNKNPENPYYPVSSNDTSVQPLQEITKQPNYRRSKKRKLGNILKLILWFLVLYFVFAVLYRLYSKI